MRYRFKSIDFWEEMKGVLGDIPASITDTGRDMLLDFGDVTLSAAQEQALLRLIEEKPLLRGRAAKFMEKGATLTLE